eukprot:jgi/Hompol1/3387/HPOL_006504-RA
MAGSSTDLVFVLDGTAPMRRHFNHLLSTYIEPLLRSQLEASTVLRLGLIVFGGQPPQSQATVQTRLLTRDSQAFMAAIKTIDFVGGCGSHSAAADALAATIDENIGFSVIMPFNGMHQYERQIVKVGQTLWLSRPGAV